MLISREDLRYQFQGTSFDLKKEEDRNLLGWIFNQFLYGEITGIQCGYWLYQAPSFAAATFLAKQASEELAHFRKFLRVLSLLGTPASRPHWAVKFLASGMIGTSWGEHVCIEMALGEGLVLSAFYAMEDTISDPEIHKLLQSSALEEEKHVEFGERETREWLKLHPNSKDYLLALAFIQAWALKHLKKFVIKKLTQNLSADHPVLSQFEKFYDHALKSFEKRIELLGLTDRPLRDLGTWTRFKLIACLPIWKLIEKFKRKTPLLTSSYLSDPILKVESATRIKRPSTTN